ncbi:MAG: antibiotic biosynthesis monooxygenase [Alphaproteobacteria bacterium]|nr:MAG: antibiotic biosynthesis monooxygenase [Alphaproteobacteria bacterium]
MAIVAVLVKFELEREMSDADKTALDAMESASRQEDGCLDYAFSREISHPNAYRVVELWKDMAALEYHFTTPHMAAFMAALGALSPQNLEIKVYELGAERALPTAG